MATPLLRTNSRKASDMTEEQINHALRRRYGFPQDTIDDPDREPEQVILDELQAGPSWLDCLCACGRCITARHRLLLSGQIEQDPHGWRLSSPSGEQNGGP